jgi:hypothetical protein
LTLAVHSQIIIIIFIKNTFYLSGILAMLFKCTKILQGFASSPFLKPPPPIKKIQPPLPPPKINKNINLQEKTNTNKNFLNNNATNVKIIEKMV